MDDTSGPGVSQSNSGGPPAAPRIAVVDDDPDIRDLLTELFVDDGFQVITYSSRESAASALTADLPALLITDARLRGADGFDMLRTLVESGRQLPPIVVLTAAPEESYAIHTALLERAGARVMRKPFDVEQLLELARTLTGWPGIP